MDRVLDASEKQWHRLDDETAARLWATKEAVAKSLGTGFWQRGVEWTDIRVRSNGQISLHGEAAKSAGPSRFLTEIRTTTDYVVVTVQRYSNLP